MTEGRLKIFRPGEVIGIKDIPSGPVAEFRERIISQVNAGARLVNLFACPTGARAATLYAVLAFDSQSRLAILATNVSGSYPALTNDCPQAHVFERAIAEETGLEPEGHPDLRPVRFLRGNPDGKKVFKTQTDDSAPGGYAYYQVAGSAVHEVAVGPVHAGVIEPGHFRFQCQGERVFNLEISLGYQHRGVERALVGGPDKRTIHYFETLAGDTTVGHTLAYCQLLEAMTGTTVSVRRQILRAVALGLERLANHTGDLGALANDVAFLPTASYCGRLRGDFLNLTATLCGNRFGRSFLKPGGTVFDVDAGMVQDLRARLDALGRDLTIAVELMFDNASVMERLEGTGTVAASWVDTLGLVGPAARACGKERDVRLDFPSGIYCVNQIPISTFPTGDVFTRTCVRWLEVQRSLEFVRELLSSLPEGEAAPVPVGLPAESLVVSLVEGWRGEIAHLALTDGQGRFSHYKVVDPSLHNWAGLAVALRGEEISNFPLCNKSFNLSYCGVDL